MIIKIYANLLICVILYFPAAVKCQFNVVSNDEFSPSVTARCDRGIMYVSVVTAQPFYGIIHARDHRKPQCLITGNGGFNTTLKVSLLAAENDELYCGVQKYKGERTVSIIVRPHKSLELSDDKFYYLSCASSGYRNVRGGTSKVSLKLLENDQSLTRVVHGNSYVLRAKLITPDSLSMLRMKNCFAFSTDTNHVELTDSSGCPSPSKLISQFTYNFTNSAEATIYEMFKFPGSGKMHIQCDVALCRGCPEPICDPNQFGYKGRDSSFDGYAQLSASMSALVVEPTDEIVSLSNLEECTEWRFPWLITLCIILAILLLLMLLINLFMCSSLTCKCVKTEVVEREPSEVEEYDPYRVDWSAPYSGSHYGSRMSLNKLPDRYNDSTLKSTKPYHYGDYDNGHFVPDNRDFQSNYSTLQHQRPHSRSVYSTNSLKSQKSQKSQKSNKSRNKSHPMEIDYSNHHHRHQ